MDEEHSGNSGFLGVVVSSAFVLTAGKNTYLKLFAENQPITQVINAARALMLGYPIGNYGYLSVMWSLLILIICVPIAAILFRRKTSE